MAPVISPLQSGLRKPLPIDALFPAIESALGSHRNLVIEAAPGAGKTTRVPPALLGQGSTHVYVLEPRRLAARMAARRVAEELGEKAGATAGYQVRFEDACGPATRLRYVTEGILIRRLLNDPELTSASAVVLDEFHERHIETDLALALLRSLQLGPRPDLRIVVMSATLDVAPIAAYLGSCPVLRSEGRLYPIEIEYAGYSAQPLEAQVRQAVEKAAAQPGGDILVFLPGAREIRRAMQECGAIAAGSKLLVLPLHGDLPAQDQDRAVLPSRDRKLILSTNVAESSITIDGVTVVIDSGLARIPVDSPSSGLPSLEIRRISQASARQRAGRAGRTRPGHVIRLYSHEDFVRRPAADVPEIQRRDLSPAMLELQALGISDLQWFEPPPQASLDAAHALLERIEASKHATAMARLPVHPRIARMLIEARRRGAVRLACAAAARITSSERPEASALLDLLDREPSEQALRIERQLERLVGRGEAPAASPAGALCQSILAAFPDRAARRRSGLDAQLATGRAALLPHERAPEFLTAIDIEDRREFSAPLIRLYAPIEPGWLLDMFPERIREHATLRWNRAGERVEAVSELRYEEIVIASSTARPESSAAAPLLIEKALEAGIASFTDKASLDRLFDRIAFAADQGVLAAVPDDVLNRALLRLAEGATSFAELRAAAAGDALARAVKNALPDAGRSLDAIAPEHVSINGRRAQLHYRKGQPPWLEARLQDFFGLLDGPRIAGGRVPVVLHLLAPNRRPVQTTTDLAGFWQRLYPQVRRELSRRYPKHKWPENPLLKP